MNDRISLIQATKSGGIFLFKRYLYTFLAELCSAIICKHETDDRCYDMTNLVVAMTVTTKFVVKAVTMKLVITVVMTKLALTAVTKKLVVTPITTKLVVLAFF